MDSNVTTIALVDDHVLLRNSLAVLINSFENCRVVLEVSNGKELIQQIQSGIVPDIVLLDLNMPELDGYDTAEWLTESCPEVQILMLTMYDTELALIRLLQLGVKGFLKKDIHPAELKEAINAVKNSGYYYSHDTTGKLVNLFRGKNASNLLLHRNMLNETEMTFLKYACTELTYKEIAQEMKFNPRSIDNLRDNLFTKLDVKSRVGLAIYSLKHGIVLQ